MIRMTGVIGIIILAIALALSGYMPQSIEERGRSTDENILDYFATPVPAEENTPENIVTPSATEENTPSSFVTPGTAEKITDWWGVIKNTKPGSQYDDYFEWQSLGQVIYFGIDSMYPAVKAQIEALRNSGKIVHLYGTLFSNVPDYNGSQVQVDRIEIL